MSIPLWTRDLAAHFWERAGGPLPFPRRLAEVAELALDVTVETLPRPNLNDVLDRLRDQGHNWPCDQPNVLLRACLLARGGSGYIFLDSGDEEAEQNYSLAHELAHFLRDYLQPREQVRKVLGERALEVLDGLRPADPDEALSAVLRGVRLGYHVHLLPDFTGGRESESAEREADLLACELLAPWDEVLVNRPTGLAASIRQLEVRFGLPSSQAERHAWRFLRAFSKARPDPLVLRLFPK